MTANRILLTEKEAAELLGIPPATLSVWRSTKRYAIPYVKVGRLVRYPSDTLAAWVESRTRGTEDA